MLYRYVRIHRFEALAFQTRIWWQRFSEQMLVAAIQVDCKVSEARIQVDCKVSEARANHEASYGLFLGTSHLVYMSHNNVSPFITLIILSLYHPLYNALSGVLTIKLALSPTVSSSRSSHELPFGYCPSNSLYLSGVLLRAVYNPTIIIIQLLLRGGSTQATFNVPT